MSVIFHKIQAIVANKVTKLICNVKNNSFVKSIMTLSAGILISQAVSLIATPIISRIYDPSVLGDYSIITSNASILSVVACLGLLSAVMVPKSDVESKSLCRLLLLLIVIIPALILLVALAFSDYWKIFEVNLDYSIGCLILYLYIVLTNVSSLCYSYVNRKKMYRVLFWNPALGTVTNAGISIVLGLLKCGLWGYIMGNIVSSFVVIIHMLMHTNPFQLDTKQQIKPVQLLKKYKEFPLYLLPSNLIGTVSQQLPVQLISRLFDKAILGSYSMCISILSLPSKFLAAPINRVYYREATERYRNGASIGEFSLRILSTNIRIATIPISLLTIFGPTLFSVVLGTKWEQAGNMSSILGAYYLVMFCSGCISGKFVIIQKQKTILLLNTISLVVIFCSFYLSHLLHMDILMSLTIYAISGSLLTLFDISIFMRYTGIKLKTFFLFVIKSLLLPIAIASLIRGLLYTFIL